MTEVVKGKSGVGLEEVVSVTDAVIIEHGHILEEIIDVEVWVLAGRVIHPRARGYVVRIDKHKYEFNRPEVTGRNLLVKAGKSPPEKFILRQVHKSGAIEKVGLDQTVNLAAHGVEKFKTMPKTAQDGLL